jgi:hypothetical protein
MDSIFTNYKSYFFATLGGLLMFDLWKKYRHLNNLEKDLCLLTMIKDSKPSDPGQYSQKIAKQP